MRKKRGGDRLALKGNRRTVHLFSSLHSVAEHLQDRVQNAVRIMFTSEAENPLHEIQSVIDHGSNPPF